MSFTDGKGYGSLRHSPPTHGRTRELEAAGAKSAKVGDEEMPDGVRWIQSYVVKEPDGRIGTFCIY